MKEPLGWLNEVGETVATSMFNGKQPPGKEVEELIWKIQEDAREELRRKSNTLCYELESLRQENSRLRKDVDRYKGHLIKKMKEIDALREALEKISAYRLGGVKIATSHIAEEALNPLKE